MEIESQFSDIFFKIIRSFPKDNKLSINEILLISFMHHAHKNAKQKSVLLNTEDLGNDGWLAVNSLFDKDILEVNYQPEQASPGWLFLTLKSKEIATELGGFCSIFLRAPLHSHGDNKNNHPEPIGGVLRDFFGWGIKSRESCDDFFKYLFENAQNLH